MILPIRQLGEPVLKAACRTLNPDELAGPTVRDLARDMADTLTESGGVGLAAPQVGSSVRLILAGSFPTERNPDRPDVPTFPLVNPTLVVASAAKESAWEGCLSFPQFRVRVARHLAVTVEYQDLDGNPRRLDASGFLARVLQHEIDHLDGLLTIDRATGPADVEEVPAT